jgi:hypothetical protein
MATLHNITQIDISQLGKEKIFAIDTNALYWIHYSQISSPHLAIDARQLNDYPNFVEDLLNNGNKLITTCLNVTELVSIVENTQLRIYNKSSGIKLKKKDYRAIQSERQKYQREVSTILGQLKGAYGNQLEVVPITQQDIEEYAKKIGFNKCDIFDFIIIEFLKGRGITNFISDDGDFHSIDGIDLYTSNI